MKDGFHIPVTQFVIVVLIKEKVCDCLLKVQTDADEQLAHSLQSRDGICHKCGGAALNRLTLKIADLGLSKKLQVANCRSSVLPNLCLYFDALSPSPSKDEGRVLFTNG